MGILSFLFGGGNQQPQPPQIQSIYPQGAILKLQSGVLPTIQADKLILGAGAKRIKSQTERSKQTLSLMISQQ